METKGGCVCLTNTTTYVTTINGDAMFRIATLLEVSPEEYRVLDKNKYFVVLKREVQEPGQPTHDLWIEQ